VTGHDGQLWAALSGPGLYRLADQGRLRLRYRNVGDTEMPAPLFKIHATRGNVRFRVLGDDETHADELYVLGVSNDGASPHRLAPGASNDLRITYRALTMSQDIAFVVRAFQPHDRDFVEWRDVPNPAPVLIAPDEWSRALSPLSVGFGSRWSDVQTSLGGLARRVERRGEIASNVVRLFRFAFAESQGRPNAAVAGRVVLAASLGPVASTDIGAFADGELIARSTTDRLGRFVLAPIAAGVSVNVGVVGHDVVDEPSGLLPVTVPAASNSFADSSGDVIGLTIAVAPTARVVSGEPPAIEGDLPDRPLTPPDHLFTMIAGWPVRVVTSWDPNAKEDEVETADDDLPPADDALPADDLLPIEAETDRPAPTIHYTIYFENSRCATASARTVRIVDRLDATLFDLTTLRVGVVSLGGDDDDKLIPIDANLWDRREVIVDIPAVRAVSLDPFRERGEECNGGALPDCDGEEDEGEGEGAGADLDTVDTNVQIELGLDGSGPEYELFCEISSCFSRECEVWEGFLPPNDCATHQGEGYLTFSVRAAGDVGPGASRENEAAITFDHLRTITVEVVTDLDPPVPPEPPENPVPADDPDLDPLRRVPVEQALSWEGSPWVDAYRLRVWELADDGERIPEPVVDTEVDYPWWIGEPWQEDTTYEWQVDASNDHGTTPGATWTFRTLPPLPPPPADDLELVGPIGDVELIAEGVTLDWEASSNADEYEEYYSVYLRAGAGEEALVAYVGSRTDWQALDLETDTNYEWRVVAENGGGMVEGPTWSFSTSTATLFRRGDASADERVDISDAVFSLNYLFLGADPPPCLQAADFDDNGRVEITDAIATLSFLFAGGAPPAAPADECGVDATDDPLGCESFPPCD